MKCFATAGPWQKAIPIPTCSKVLQRAVTPPLLDEDCWVRLRRVGLFLVRLVLALLGAAPGASATSQVGWKIGRATCASALAGAGSHVLAGGRNIANVNKCTRSSIPSVLYVRCGSLCDCCADVLFCLCVDRQSLLCLFTRVPCDAFPFTSEAPAPNKGEVSLPCRRVALDRKRRYSRLHQTKTKCRCPAQGCL